MSEFVIVAGTLPARLPDASIAVAARRAGETGLLDLTHADLRAAEADAALRDLLAESAGEWAVRMRAGDRDLQQRVTPLLEGGGPGLLVLTDAGELPNAVSGRGADQRVLAEVHSLEEALAAVNAGVDGVVATGCESGSGAAGAETTFVLLQRLAAALDLPVLARGGLGRHSVAAARACGAAGVVVDSMLLLTRESPLSRRARAAVGLVDGGEQSAATARFLVDRTPGDSSLDHVDLAVAGQDTVLAGRVATRFRTTGRVVQELRRSAAGHLREAAAADLLAPGSALARSHGTRYPLVQGPMTRVSDQPGFADAVSRGGGLPFLALALMPGREVAPLLERTSELLGERPWGVGILGFVPEEVRREQLTVLAQHRPPYALIAGGHPDQAAELESAGTTTYLHTPSPGLLRHFLDSGVRRFVFEGRECGGHVGPRSSFLLWDEMVEELLTDLAPAELAQCHVLLAGGIHDSRSAAAAAAVAGPLAGAGAKVGLLMGTGYVFTEEIRTSGAVTGLFQETALSCEGTALLESGRGYLTRCAVTPVVGDFRARQEALVAEGRSREEVLEDLESFNLGRLRIASKGRAHGEEGPVPVPEPEQRREGLFMMGDVAALRSGTVPVAELHRQVSEDGAAVLAEAATATSSETGKDAGTATQVPVAIIGMSCLLPGAPDVETYWANILAGRDSVTEVPERRWPTERYFDADASAADRTYSRWGGFVDEVDFDPMEFGMPPNSLPHVEGMQLLALHAVRDALADAGLDADLMPRETTSVVLGAGGGVADLGQRYAVRAALTGLLAEDDPELMERLPSWSEDSFPGILVNVTAGRIANRFDLGGLNCTIDAACASSLAAVHLAVRELESGTSDLVVAGGVDTMQNSFGYLAFAKTGALSPTGRCRPFDADADGIAISEGVAVVVLKRLADARRDGDRVYAVIRGVAGSSDGRARGLTAPLPDGQARALDRAYAAAGLSPATVGLVEAHGTGTVAGDRAEVETLCRVFEAAGAAQQGCAIGSVKSMIGHTKCAAGVAGMVKVAKALHHRVLPPTIGVSTPNTTVDFEASPFYLNTTARPWYVAPGDGPRRAGVSAFGFGGTNFHAVLEAADATQVGARRWPAELFTWTGARDQVVAAIEEVQELLCRPEHDRLDLEALAAATVDAPTRDGGRLAVVATSHPDLVRKLALAAGALADPSFTAPGVSWTAEPGRPSLAFLYPGQGAQRAGMLRELAVHLPLTRRVLEQSHAVMPELFDLLYPRPTFTDDARAAAEDRVQDTRVAQPALGVVEMALTQLLRTVGVRPAATAGHSYGEYVALWAGGALSDDDLLRVSVARGRHIADAAGAETGSMMAVMADADVVRELLQDVSEVWVSNLNSPAQTVVSGTAAGLERAGALLTEADVEARTLRVAAGFHSPLVADAADALAESLHTLQLRPGDVPVFANSTGAPYPPEPEAMAALLVEHLVRPVQFAAEVAAMHEAGIDTFLELGPGSTLTGLVDQTLSGQRHLAISVDGAGGGVAGLLHALGTLWSRGVAVDLGRLADLRGVAPRTVAEVLAEAGRTPSTWVVGGAGARRRDDDTVAAPVERRPATALPTIPTLPSPSNGSSGDLVADFQSMMGRFLDMEREVMLTWLDAPPDAVPPTIQPPLQPTAPAAAQVAPVAEPVPVAEPEPLRQPGPVPVLEELRALVAARTGYPAELLGDDLDLEADLGIDSIKRTEVIGTFVSSRPPDERQLLATVTSGLRGVRTLQALAEPIIAALGQNGTSGPTPVEAPGGETLEHWQVVPEPTKPAGLPPRLDGSHVAVVGSPAARAVTDRVVGRLVDLGANVRVVDLGLRPLVLDEAQPIDAVLQLSVAGDAEPGEDVAAQVAAVLGVAGQLGSRIRADGSFLVLRTGAGPGVEPEGAALAGAMQTLAAELPGSSVRVVEDRDGAATGQQLDELLGELFSPEGPVHLVWEGGRPHTSAFRHLEAAEGGGPVLVEDGGVALLTGGATGITAILAEGLARSRRLTLELVGRSPLPDAEEDATTAAVTDVRRLRQALLEAAPGGTTPGEVEQELRRLLRAREIRATLARLREHGCDAHYRQVDVRDPGAVRDLVERIVETHGRLDLVVHGAGVVADRLVEDKDPETVAQVVATKVGGALNLVHALPAGVRGVVLMSSVAAWFGNPGQADYAAANRALDALAARLDGELPAHVVSLSWGPWDAPGMVTDQVRRGFEERGVALVAPDAGVRAFLDVVDGADVGSHVVLGSGPWSRHDVHDVSGALP